MGPGQVARKPAAVQPGHGTGAGCAPALLLPVLDPHPVRISLPLGRGEGPSEMCAKSRSQHITLQQVATLHPAWNSGVGMTCGHRIPASESLPDSCWANLALEGGAGGLRVVQGWWHQAGALEGPGPC